MQLLGRPIRIDHVEKYRLPQKLLEAEDGKGLPNVDAGHAYQDAELSNNFNIHQGQDLFAPVNQTTASDQSVSSDEGHRKRKGKHKSRKTSRKKHESKKERKRGRHGSDSERSYDDGVKGQRKKHRKAERESKHRRRDRQYNQESAED